MAMNMLPLSAHSSFQFACTRRLSCFNSCCRDLNQFLTPFDILQLKNHLGITSGEFLARYTTQHIGPKSGLPVVALKPADTSELICPFATSSGCSIYEARPSSCRMYPVARAITRSRNTGRVTEHFMLLKEHHCRGFHQNTVQTVVEWIEAQGLVIYNEINDMLMEIISLKNLHVPGPLDTQSQDIFQMALYDVDTFRDNLLKKGWLKGFYHNAECLESIEKNDIELLKLGHRWVKQTLFGARGYETD